MYLYLSITHVNTICHLCTCVVVVLIWYLKPNHSFNNMQRQMFLNVAGSNQTDTYQKVKTGRQEARELRSNANKLDRRGCRPSTVNTYSLRTQRSRRSCVMFSCQRFLIPVAEGGPAVDMEPTPPASFIRLEEREKSSFYQ